MTPDGYAMHRNNGDRFFEAYPKVFNSGSEEDGVESTSSAGEKWYIRSDVDASFRTLRSAETLVSRIIERGGGQGSSSNMANFRVHMDDQLYSTIQPNVHVCPRMGELEAEYWEKSPSVKKLSDKWDKEVRPELEAGLQADVIQGRPLGLGKDYGLFSVGDCVFSHRCSTVGRTTPAETPFSDTLLEKAFSYLPVYFGLNARHAKQRVGPLMTQVLGDLETKKEKNFLLYSGHDTGPLAPLLGAFEAEVETEWVWPPFASYINFEFTSDGLARVIYAGQVLKTKYCNDFAGNICKAETLLGRLRDLSPDYEKDCTLVGRIAGEGTKTSARNVELEDEMRIYQ
ncbi:unnamed protein product [Amoebophrya sp. A25]|nr:unnamed protein product [Amoebophrya sp. A25]|eukprot:GSA25T00010078001.1